MVDTPREVRGLGIRIEEAGLKVPKGWASVSCRNSVADMLDALDGFGLNDRLVGEPEAMPHLTAFRNQLLADAYGDPSATGEKIRAFVAALPPSAALDLLAGQHVSVDGAKVGVWKVQLDRGAGFYYDVCYAVANFDYQTIQTLIVDGNTGEIISHRADALWAYLPDQALW